MEGIEATRRVGVPDLAPAGIFVAIAWRGMVTGVHAIVFTGDVAKTREFFRDTLGLRSVDAGGGWLIFALPPAELATHPTTEQPHHELYLMCDDIHATVEELKQKGVELDEDVTEQRWGLTTSLKLPGGGQLGLYEPRHPSPLLSDRDQAEPTG
jgi:catechol 2,3-dioxygenase-like lactoylglutathione lyase family enzyme